MELNIPSASEQIKGHNRNVHDKSAGERAREGEGAFIKQKDRIFEPLRALGEPRPARRSNRHQGMSYQLRHRNYRNRSDQAEPAAAQQPTRSRHVHAGERCRKARRRRQSPAPKHRAPVPPRSRSWRAFSIRRPGRYRGCAQNLRRCCLAELLKNMLTQIDSVSLRGSTWMCCARSRRFHRHTEIDCVNAYIASASTIHAGFMPFTRSQNDGRWMERAQIKKWLPDAEASEDFQQQIADFVIVETAIVT